jgi:hypothetical protein
LAFYLVRAKPKAERLALLRDRLASGEVSRMRPFGLALDHSLREARVDGDGFAIWEEEDYCRPPLAQERAAVLDTHFDEIQVEPVSQGAGWQRINSLRSLWFQTAFGKP